MFEPEKLPTPDDEGYFIHPDIPGDEESDNVQSLCKDAGYECAFVGMESDSPDMADEFYAGDQESVARWNPTSPEGGGWMLVAKYDTEEGPHAMFVRPFSRTYLH